MRKSYPQYILARPKAPFSYPKPFLRAVNRARREALAKFKPDTIKTWYPVKHCACSIILEYIENAQCLAGYLFFMVSGLDFAKTPRRAPLTARKTGSGYDNAKSS